MEKVGFEARATRRAWFLLRVPVPAGPSAVDLTLVVGFFPELPQPEATSTLTITATDAATARIPNVYTAPQAEGVTGEATLPGMTPERC